MKHSIGYNQHSVNHDPYKNKSIKVDLSVPIDERVDYHFVNCMSRGHMRSSEPSSSTFEYAGNEAWKLNSNDSMTPGRKSTQHRRSQPAPIRAKMVSSEMSASNKPILPISNASNAHWTVIALNPFSTSSWQ